MTIDSTKYVGQKKEPKRKDIKIEQRITLSFWMGWAFAVAVMCLVQDWYGLEGYIEHIQKVWVDLPWWIWPPIMAVIFYFQGKNVSNFKKELLWKLIKKEN